MIHVNASTTRTTFAIFVILACAFVLRITHLNHYDLWFDELGAQMYSAPYLTRAADITGDAIPSLALSQMRNDPHSPLYYSFIYIYSILFGDGKSLRILSVIFSLLSLIVFYKFSRLFFDERVSLYALLIMAFNPFYLWYAQEARVYAMANFFSLLTIYSCGKAFKTDKAIYWILFTASGILAMYSSYCFGFLLFISGSALLFKQNRCHFHKWFLGFFIILVCLVIPQALLSAQLSMVGQNFWIPKPTPEILLFTWKIFNLGYTATPMQYAASLLLFSVLFVCGVSALYPTQKQDMMTLLLFLFFPIIAIYAFSMLFAPIYIHRQVFICSPFYYLLVAKGLGSLRQKFVRLSVLACVMLIMGGSVNNFYRGVMAPYKHRATFFGGVLPKKQYTDLIDYLGSQFREGDLMAAVDIQSHAILRAHLVKNYQGKNYRPAEMYRYLFFPPYLQAFDVRYLGMEYLLKSIFFSEDVQKLWGLTFFHPGPARAERIDLDQKDFKRVWLLSSSWEKKGPLTPNTAAVRSYMDTHFEKVLSRQKDGIYLDLYNIKNLSDGTLW